MNARRRGSGALVRAVDMPEGDLIEILITAALPA